ncbi:MAG TPA: hypothetical protein VEC96_10065, partial [Anaerolineae bacterium]|nr:hypothetical protein [Anaerolineae bacterium]
GLDPGWAILADRPTPPALIASDFAEQVALQFLKTVWGAATGIYPTSASDLSTPSSVGQADSLSYYLSRRAAAASQSIVSEMSPQAAGEQLIALSHAPPAELSASAASLDLNFGNALKLVGWEPVETTYPLPEDVAARLPRANWQIALYWQASQPLAEDYTISVRPLVKGQLIMANGEAVIQDHQPVWGFYPTSQWQPGIIVRDVYALSLPVGVTPEAVQIVVYRATDAGFENLAEQTIMMR